VADLKVIPVIDILNGAVVHAVKGERSQYLPFKVFFAIPPFP
jgi:uncharacterized protein related to proFAR isomerase